MIPRMRSSYETLLSISFLCLVLVLQDAQVATMHYSSPTGLCQHYNGNCSVLLNSTKPRYINSSLGLNETDRVANALLDAVTRLYTDKEKDKRCKPILEKTVCFFVFPFCSPQETKLDYCREDCNHLSEICGGDLNQIVGAGKFILSGKLSSIVFRFDECKDLKSETETSGNTTCKHLPYIMEIPTMSVQSESKKKKNNIFIYVGAAVGFVVIIVFIILILVTRYRRGKLKKDGKANHEFENSEFGDLYEGTLETQDKDDNDVAADVLKKSGHERNPMTSMTSVVPAINPSNNESEWETQEISYIVLLKDWEISPSHLKVQVRTLGVGQFGVVKQGLYTPSEKSDPEIVAVKMLKDNARESDRSDLLAELEILKKINNKRHPNVIRFIGGCLMQGKLLVLTEFCPGGNLRKFLRKSKISGSPEDSKLNCLSLTSTLNERQLLKLATDVANGMVHLSAQKFVHRDLAARNILLGNDNVAKVSDFGLARNIESAEEYILTTQNLLPVKWMAVESLLYGRFTTASDVWSFGVLLYEIATLGEEPYKNLSPYNIINHVGSGCRMSKPAHCSTELYEIMSNCWQVDPKHRPTFTQILQDLRDMLSANEKSYISVCQVKDEKRQTTNQSK